MKKQKLFLTLIFVFLLGNIFAQTVYVTKSGKKYHKANCRSLSKSSIAISLADANAKGYQPCKVCYGKSANMSSQTTQPKEQSNTKVNDSESTQCNATTKAGARCKRKTKSPNGFCKQHGGD